MNIIICFIHINNVNLLSMNALSIWEINKELHCKYNHNVSSGYIIFSLWCTL